MDEKIETQSTSKGKDIGLVGFLSTIMKLKQIHEGRGHICWNQQTMPDSWHHVLDKYLLNV